jgi:hypothetical protein
MSKPFYSEYVKHALRFYSRNLVKPTVFKSEADKQNWLSCYSVIKSYPEDKKNILFAVYSGFDTLPDEVYKTAKAYCINQNIIWDLMKDVEHKVARRRGLI